MTVGARYHVIAFESWCVLPTSLGKLKESVTILGLGRTGLTYLFGLAFEALLRLVGPPSAKGRLPRLDHAGIERMDLSVVAQVGLDGRHDCPAALGSVLDVLLQRVVALFPTIEGLAAEKAHDIVGVAGVRLEEESGFGKLFGTCQFQLKITMLTGEEGAPRLARAIHEAIAVTWERANSRWTPSVFRQRAARPEKTTGDSHRQRSPLRRSWPLSRYDDLLWSGRC